MNKPVNHILKTFLVADKHKFEGGCVAFKLRDLKLNVWTFICLADYIDQKVLQDVLNSFFVDWDYKRLLDRSKFLA